MAPIRRPGGWVVPGYKYLGPFNPLDNGKPVNKADHAAKKHDFKYSDYIQKGKNPYLYFNKADSDFLEDLESDRSFGGWIGRTVFGIKRAIAPSLGEPPAKKNKQAALKRHLYFARSNSKRSKMDPQPDQGDQAEAGPSTERAGQGAPGGGGMGGGAGRSVGISTGGWLGGTTFGDNVVITRITRQWYCPIYNGHMYKQVSNSTSGYGFARWAGMSTPWGYFDFNVYAGHFTPQDWQRLTNEYIRWRPKRMTIKVYNLQIKQVVNLGMDTLYNNDLTAGVHIFCDGSHQYPYPQNPWNEGIVPELPNDVWKLPQYGYYQWNTAVDNEQWDPNHPIGSKVRTMAPLYLLETSSHEVLRTGEETQFSFTFDCGWVNNDRAYAPPQMEFNPLVGTRRWFPTWHQNDSSYKYTRYIPYKKPTLFMPGPGFKQRGRTDQTDSAGKSRGPVQTAYIPLGGNMGASSEYNQGVAQPTTGAVELVTANTAPVNGACMATDWPTLAFDVGPHNQEDGSVTTRNIDNDMTRWNSVYMSDKNNTGELKNVWMYPNQAWNSTPICRGNPIWVKAPNTDRHTLRDSSDGSLVMDHPPGTIFIKTQKIPIPTESGNDVYLNLYVTGQVTCEIEWEVERYMTKNWRPELRNVPAISEPTAYDFNTAGKYNMPTDYAQHMPTRMGINSVL